MTNHHSHKSLGGVRLFGVLLLLASVSSAALGQSELGRLRVIVKDKDDKLAANVTVTLSGGPGGGRECTTGPDGLCLFGSLEPGEYQITASLGEWRALTQSVTLTPGQRSTRVLTLPPTPPFTAMVAIENIPPRVLPPPEVNTPLPQRNAPGRLGASATSEETERLPNRSRSEAPVLDLLPGVFSAGGDAFAGFLFNGQPGTQNNERVGGVDANVSLVRSAASFQDANAAFANVADRRSIKTYKSFSVSASNTPADVGTGTGGQLVKDITSGKAAKEKESPIKGEAYEYLARDRFAARDFFDFAEKPSLRFDLFGLSLSGGPSYENKDRYPQLLYYGNYEGIRAASGNTAFAAVPRLSLRPRAAAAVVPLFDLFRAGGATLVENGTDDQNFDILRLDSQNHARKDALTLRLDAKFDPDNALTFIYLGSATRVDLPDGVTGRRSISRNTSHSVVFNYSRVLTRKTPAQPASGEQPKPGEEKLKNVLIFAFQSDPVRLHSRVPAGTPTELLSGAFTVGGEVTPTGIEGQPLPLSVANAGGLLLSSDFGGRRLRFHPRKLSFVDQVTWTGKKHTLTFGGEARLIRAGVAQLMGTTYAFKTVDDFLADRANVTYVGDLGSYTGGDTGVGRKASQEYFIGYGQDAWQIKSNMLLNYGVRYEYYSVLREARDRAVLVDPETGELLPAGTPFYRSRRNNFLPRVSWAWAPKIDGNFMEIRNGPTVFSASFGMHVGPDVFDNLLRPVFSDRVRVSSEGSVFPVDPDALAAGFFANPNRRLRPLALARGYTGPARVYKFDATVKKDLIARIAPDTEVEEGKPEVVEADNPTPPTPKPKEKKKIEDDTDVVRELYVTVSYVGNRGRGLLLRNFANPIISVRTASDPSRTAVICRRFDTSCDEPQAVGPYGEIDYLTTGGRSSFDSLQVSLRGRVKKFLRLFQADYTLARSRGNTEGDNAIGAGNPLDYDYDFGYNSADVRHKFSFGALLFLDCDFVKICRGKRKLVQELTSNYKFAAIGTFQSGTPIDVRLSRPDVVYVDAGGKVYAGAGAGRRAALNVPGGGATVAAYRPDLIPGVNPFLDGFADRRFLNPEAFAIPAPGALGNLRRGALRGPGYKQVDVSVLKEIRLNSTESANKRTLTINVDVNNVFNFTNFRVPPAKLQPTLGMDAALNQMQPGQAITEAAAGTGFGVLNRTFKRKQDLGSSRQFQFGFSLKF